MARAGAAWPDHGGETGEMLRAPGFEAQGLGPVAEWPAELRVAIDLMLASPQRAFVTWGADYTFFYNDRILDAYRDENSRIFGRSYRDSWPKVWESVGPYFERAYAGEAVLRPGLHVESVRGNGEKIDIRVDLSMTPIRATDGRVLGILGTSADRTEHYEIQAREREARAGLEEKTRTLEVVNAAGAEITGERDSARVAQTAVDAGVALIGAKFGAFFYNNTDEAEGERYMLYALAGAPRSAFDKFPMPRITKLFEPTFAGTGIIRVDDITADERYGLAGPFHGMPKGHLPVRSYLAVPVRTPAGDVIGGLLYGHPEPGMFGAAAEASLASLAGQAALAMDNARLFETVARELVRRAQAEEELRVLNERLEIRVAEALLEREAAFAALQQAQKMETIGKLTGGVAHDFNNLLQVISGNLQLLARDVQGQEKPERRVANALAGVQRGSKLASQLLAFGRRQPLEPRVLNVGRFLGGMEDMLRRALGEAIGIEVITSGGLWNCQADPTQLENAILNLAINARDAMGGAGKLTIEAANASLDDDYTHRLEDVPPGQYVMLAVTDTGSGIAPELIEQVFEPFFSTKPEGQGSGLGLSMVYGFVKQSGGHVKIYSEIGHGTTVKLYLPRVRKREEVLVASHETVPMRGGTETILVAEDDPDVQATVVELLTELGYTVLRANDATSALSVIESGMAIDLLFTDVVMPGSLKSPELARLARARLPELAVLFTSGYTENAIVHDGRLDAGVELLSKPYSREQLARKVRAVLEAKAAKKG
ncbi:ATP-binding protein [Sphingomonas sp. HITSZ_GF]|uniref:ATP-binding protein n=1 Tax=Sphingomonas sp. HITSZ_GF TaxID=3037247 RepID=UPI00240D782E|nr:ATP-binding protein [Sphingomonas sp. HITSZ_GF]MDG2535318.1 ATP-binding protein [Sphingomonas sp. HITSZ_GF]